MAKFFENGKRQKYSNWKTPIDLHTYLDNIRTAWRPKPKSWWKKVPPYPYVRAAAYIPTFLAFFQFRIPDWFRSSSIYDYKRSRSPDIFQIFICHFDVTLYFIHWMNFPYLRIEMILRLQKWYLVQNSKFWISFILKCAQVINSIMLPAILKMQAKGK